MPADYPHDPEQELEIVLFFFPRHSACSVGKLFCRTCLVLASPGWDKETRLAGITNLHGATLNLSVVHHYNAAQQITSIQETTPTAGMMAAK